MINPSYGAVFSTQRLTQLRQHERPRGGDGSVPFPTPVAHMLFAVRRVQEVMGMPVTVNVARDDVDPGALDDVFADFQHLNNVFSPFVETSEVSRIDRGELALEEAGELASQVINLCRQYERATDGYFSAWIGGRFDPSGLVKGWAIDRACSILDRRGYRDFF